MPAAAHTPLLLLAGPTATGKSELALQLAEILGGEIISVDSMQVYRGLDIGTAKPSAAERARVPHHLIDVAEINESFDAARFVTLATVAVEEITRRGRVPILCGGTGLYFKALRDGLGQSPPANPALRAELEQTPLDTLLVELRERDPQSFASIDQKNVRRVVRAVEVIRLTGRPFSEQRAAWASDSHAPQHPSFGVTRPPADLHERINRRVDNMFRRGLVEETRGLLERGLAENRTAMQAIGYRQVAEHLRGERPLPDTIELVKVRTRQFAKRQFTWFRKHAELEWIELSTPASLDQAGAQIAQRWCESAKG